MPGPAAVAARKRIAIVGGGASGVGLAWCLTSQAEPRATWDITLLHDEDELGGHSRTIPVWFDDQGRGHAGAAPPNRLSHPVDIGVQFVCQSLYPNLYRQLQLPSLRDQVPLKRHPALRISGAFSDELCWGNFPEYQQGPRFERCFDAETRRLAAKFETAVHRAWWGRAGGRRLWNMKVGDYLTAAGIPADSNFVRYLLIPYLCIINGYGTEDLYETTLTDLFPIFTRLPRVQDAGPYASFLQPGYGWDRFTEGATSWVLAMARQAAAAGAALHTRSRVRRVASRSDGVTVDWEASDPAGGTRGLSERFDVVVLTTDMTTNRELLGHDDNPAWATQAPYISAERFRLIRGRCTIHQDASLLPSCLADQKEDGQFTGAFAWGATSAPSAKYGLTYDLRASFQTYFMHNILGTPHPCYVSMYAEDDEARRPRPDTVIFTRDWRHGRWVASFFRDAKLELHRVQGHGGVFFAGNNTTIDSEEGALLSAMIIAERLGGYRYPFPKLSWANAFFAQFKSIMFPA